MSGQVLRSFRKRERHVGPPGLVLLAYWFPPAHGGGTPRPAKLCKYLSRRGWQIDVVTTARDGIVDPALIPGSARVHPVPALPGRTLLQAAGVLEHATANAWQGLVRRWDRRRGVTDAPLYAKGFSEPDQGMANSKLEWFLPALAVGLRIVRRSRPTVICATMPPAISGIVALTLHRLTGVPYVLDYRDSWTVEPNWTADDLGRPRRDPVVMLRLGVGRLIERAMVRRAAAVIVVNHQVDRFRETFRDVDPRRFVFIPNAFDPEDFQRPAAIPTQGGEGPFRIRYLGHFYGIYNPYFFLLGLRRFVRETRLDHGWLCVELIGFGFTRSMRQAVREWGLEPFVTAAPARPYSASLAAMTEADALLIVQPPVDAFRPMIPTKLYECLAAGRPILAVVPEGATARLVRAYGAGIAVDAGDPGAISQALHQLVIEHRYRDLEPHPELTQLGYPQRVEEFDRLLRMAATDDGHGAV
jgi:glycosyltransferase involved in cell wall biosynthesis